MKYGIIALVALGLLALYSRIRDAFFMKRIQASTNKVNELNGQIEANKAKIQTDTDKFNKDLEEYEKSNGDFNDPNSSGTPQ